MAEEAEPIAKCSVDGAVTERGTAFYICIAKGIAAPAGAPAEETRCWAVAKRFSHFVNFRAEIEPLLRGLAPGMDNLKFPEKSWGLGTGSGTIESRMQLFGAWLSAVGDVVLDPALVSAGIPEAERAHELLCDWLVDDMSVSEQTLDGLGLQAQCRRLFGPVFDPEDMSESLRRELLAEEEERRPRGWQFNQSQEYLEEVATVEPVLSAAAQACKDGYTLGALLDGKSAVAPPPPPPPLTPRVEKPTASASALSRSGHLLSPMVSQDRRLTLVDIVGLVDGDGNDFSVTFAEQGQIGIQYMRALGKWSKGVDVAGRGVALVTEYILPDSLARHQSDKLRPGLILTKIDNVSVKGQNFEHNMRRMKGARPIKLTFEPIGEGLTDMAMAKLDACGGQGQPSLTPMSTGKEPRIGGGGGSGGDSDAETEWNSTEPEEEEVYATQLPELCMDAMASSRIRGYVLAPGCNPWRMEVRSLCSAAEAAPRLMSYYLDRGPVPMEAGFNADGEFITIYGEHPDPVEAPVVEYYTAPQPPATAEQLREKFDVMDADGDGKVSAAELTKQLGASAEMASELVRKTDTDGDGLMEFDEYRAFVLRQGPCVLPAGLSIRQAGESSQDLDSLRRLGWVGEMASMAMGVADGTLILVVATPTDGELAAVLVVENIAGGKAEGEGSVGLAKVRVATAEGYRRKGLGEMLLRIAVATAVTLGNATAIEAGVPRESGAGILRVLERVGWGMEDLHLGEGGESRLLIVLQAQMREVSVAPLEEEDDEDEDADMVAAREAQEQRLGALQGEPESEPEPEPEPELEVAVATGTVEAWLSSVGLLGACGESLGGFVMDHSHTDALVEATDKELAEVR